MSYDLFVFSLCCSCIQKTSKTILLPSLTVTPPSCSFVQLIIDNIEAGDAGRGGDPSSASTASTWPLLSEPSAVNMRTEFLLSFCFLGLLSRCHGAPSQCNVTLEFGHNTQLSLQSPKQRTGESLVCWYSLQIIEGSGLEVFQIYVNRFSVGKLESGDCVGGYLQILDSEYDSVNEVHKYLFLG